MIYLIALLSLFFVGYWHYFKRKSLSAGATIVLFVFFWLFAGLSWETGVDWRVYSRIYEYSLSLPDAIIQGRFYSSELTTGRTVEIIFAFLSSVAKMISNEYVVLHCLVSFITSIFFFKALRKYTTNIFFAVMLYFGCIYITLNMSGVRQGLALSIVFYAYSYIGDKKFWKYALLVLLASGVHMTALLLLPLYFIVNRHIASKVIYVLVGLALCIYLFRISLMLDALDMLAQFSGNILLNKLSIYLGLIGEGLFGTTAISPKMLVYTVVLLLVAIMREQLIVHTNKYANIFFNLFVTYVLMNLFFWDTGEIVMRFSFYFLIGICVLLPEVLLHLKYKTNQHVLIVLMFTIAFISRTPVFIESAGALPYNPYQNYIWYQLTGRQSTGYERLNNWNANNGE